MQPANNLFAAYWKSRTRLPDGFVETEWLESAGSNNSGTTYLDTGLKAKPTDVYEWRAMQTANTVNQAVIGDGNGKADSNFAVWVARPGQSQPYGIEFSFGHGGDDAYKVIAPQSAYDVTEWHYYRADLTTGEGWVDGTWIGKAATLSDFPRTQKLVLFGSWRGWSSNSQFRGRISSFAAWRNGVLVRDFVPCRRVSDGAPGFYDLVGSASPTTGTPFYISSYQAQMSVGPDV